MFREVKFVPVSQVVCKTQMATEWGSSHHFQLPFQKQTFYQSAANVPWGFTSIYLFILQKLTRFCDSDGIAAAKFTNVQRMTCRGSMRSNVMCVWSPRRCSPTAFDHQSWRPKQSRVCKCVRTRHHRWTKRKNCFQTLRYKRFSTWTYRVYMILYSPTL